MSLFEIQRICASPASPSAISLQEGVGRVSKGVDLAGKSFFCIIKQGKKTREVTSPGPWPLIFPVGRTPSSSSSTADRRDKWCGRSFQYTMKASLVGITSYSLLLLFIAVKGGKPTSESACKQAFNRGVRVLSLTRGTEPHAPEHHSLSI